MNPNRTVAIKRFLEANTYPDLAILYNPEMEVQVIVNQEDGTRIDKEFKGKAWSAYTNGLQTWYPFRIPYKASTEPEYIDKPLDFDLLTYALGIGMTGWNWKERKSIYIAFDFDSLIGHAISHTKKLSPEQLEEIINQVNKIPYTTLRKSTSGKGLHLYIFLDPPVQTNNHTEHAALARAILGQLSAESNYDFSTKADASGGNMWIWHRKMKGTDGLSIIKQGIPLSYIPSNWKEHLQVITGKKKLIVPDIIVSESEESSFDLVTGQRVKIKLDDEHHKLLDFLKTTNYTSYWDNDRWMLVTHTYALKLAHQELKLRGKYDTISEGTDPTQNCFAHPMIHGGWVVRRFTPGVAEASIWEQDNLGYTKCYLNCSPNIYSASKANGGVEHKSGAFVFNETINLTKAAKELGIDLQLPERMRDRKAKMKMIPSTNKLLIEVEHNPNKDSASEMEGWYQEAKWWQRIYYLKKNSQEQESKIFNYDDTIRHIVSEDGKDLGWYAKSEDGSWSYEPLQHIKSILEGPYQYSAKEAKVILGSNIIKPWIIINRPFQHEYPGGRLWNRDAAQFRFAPTLSENPTYPTWSKIYNHLGGSLDYACQKNEWCKKNGILTGADYLKIWVANLFQRPYEHLPYLFFYGPENIGKSMFHESLSFILTKGYVRADATLKSSSNFNGEIDGAIIAVIEETDLKKDKVAAARIRDWLNCEMLPIHAKGRTPYLSPNMIHFIQANNSHDACPIFTGDTRITMIRVDPLEEEISKRQMRIQLEKEAPEFIGHMLHLELPTPTGRLSLPILATEDKLSVQQSNQTPLETFLQDRCYYAPGKSILYSELYNEFKKDLDTQETIYWTIRQLGKSLPPQYPKGRLHGIDPNWRIGNISLIPPTPEDLKKPRYVLAGQYLVLENSNDKMVNELIQK